MEKVSAFDGEGGMGNVKMENLKVGNLEKKLEEKQTEIEKLTKENFQLKTRLRNVTVK